MSPEGSGVAGGGRERSLRVFPAFPVLLAIVALYGLHGRSAAFAAALNTPSAGDGGWQKEASSEPQGGRAETPFGLGDAPWLRRLTLSAGSYDPSEPLARQAAVLGIAGGITPLFSLSLPLVKNVHVEFAPRLGMFATSEGATYGYGGLGFSVAMGCPVFLLLLPSFSVGYYAQGGGNDLGASLQFMSGVEAAVPVAGGLRLGVGFYHLSNGSRATFNPGLEFLTVRLSFSARTPRKKACGDSHGARRGEGAEL